MAINDLAQELAERAEISQWNAARILVNLRAMILDRLERGEHVTITHLGQFRLVRIGDQPETGREAGWRISFRPARLAHERFRHWPHKNENIAGSVVATQ